MVLSSKQSKCPGLTPERTPLTFHGMHPHSMLPSQLGLAGPCCPWGFSAIPVSSPALNQAYQRWMSSPELFVLTQIRCKQQPNLSSVTAHSLTRTHKFPWPNARFQSGYSKAEEMKKGCLCNEEVLLLWALLFPL